MGNTQSDVTNNVKAQADAQENETYKLIDVKGGGELIKLMKDPVLKKNSALLNEKIREMIINFLYNEGKGEDIPIQEIVYHRTGNREKLKKYSSFTTINKMIDQVFHTSLNFHQIAHLAGGRQSEPMTKRVCWDLNKRGAVGETALHLCLLNGTSLHKELAKRLVRLFPQLVNDIYLSDEYYGENALHMAIVNEDPNMVKFLLSYNIDIHQRCCGKFFCPDDQKKKREESISREYPSLPLQTNYSGFSYFGEYPLSFAAVMDQIDCVRLLFAKGVDPNRQDSNGNTVMHMLVIHNKIEIFEFLLSFGARIDIKNRLNYTPLTLAAKLGRSKMFQFILEKLRTVYWVYADISCASYPLNGLDTISVDGTTDSNSVLYSLVNSDSEEHLKIFEGIALDLLNEKWNKFVKIRFYLELLLFIIFYAMTSTSVYLKRAYLTYLISYYSNYQQSDNSTSDATICLDIQDKGVFIKDECNCIFLYPIDPDRYVRYTIECLTVLLACTAIGLSIKEIYIEKFRLYFNILMGNPTKFLYLTSCFTILLIIPFRLTCDHSTEDILTVFAIICMTLHSLYYSRGFRSVGPFVLMIVKMTTGDLVRFLAIYLVFVMGFSQAVYMACDFGIENGNVPMFRTPLESIFYIFVVSLGEFKDVYEQLDNVQYEVLGKTLLVIFMVIVGILLLNLLIAMMGNTYAEVNETKNEWLRQWAKVVLAIEQSVEHKLRLEYQKRYSNMLENGTQGFVVRWKQTETEREDLKNSNSSFREYVEIIPPMPEHFRK